MNFPKLTFEEQFYLWTAAGLLAYFLKKYILIDHWNLKAFLAQALKPMIHAVMLTSICAFLVPDLLLIAPEKLALDDIASKSPRLVEKVTLMFGLILGYTGGSVGFDLLALLYSVPIVGSFLQKLVERLKGDVPPAE